MHLNLPASDLRTADDPDVEACTMSGVAHDFRPNHYDVYGCSHISWVCVWCHGVTCGDYGQEDPCMEIHHHRTPHRAASGASWPVGSSRMRATA